MEARILEYRNSQSRNKIVLHQKELDDVSTVDVGKVLSEAIQDLLQSPKLSIRANILVESILSSAVQKHSGYGEIISISNIGILLEPELKIDLVKLIDKFSRDNILFLQWEGSIANNNLYFLTYENGIKVELKNLSHIEI